MEYLVALVVIVGLGYMIWQKKTVQNADSTPEAPVEKTEVPAVVEQTPAKAKKPAAKRAKPATKTAAKKTPKLTRSK